MHLPNLKIQAVAALVINAVPSTFALSQNGLDTGSGFGAGSAVASTTTPFVPPPPDRLEKYETDYCFQEVGNGQCYDSKDRWYGYYFFPEEDELTVEECANECGNRFGERIRGIEFVDWDDEGVFFCGCNFDAGDIDGSDLPLGWGGSPGEGFGPTVSTDECAFTPEWCTGENTHVCYTIDAGKRSKSGKCTVRGSKSGKTGKSEMSYSYSYDYEVTSKSGKSTKVGEPLMFQNCTFYNPAIFLASGGAYDPSFLTKGILDGAIAANEDFADAVDAWLEGASPEFIAMLGAQNGSGATEDSLCYALFLIVLQMEETCFSDEYYSAYVNAAANSFHGLNVANDLGINVLHCESPLGTFEELFYDGLAPETVAFIEGEAGGHTPVDEEEEERIESLTESMSMASLTESMSMSM